MHDIALGKSTPVNHNGVVDIAYTQADAVASPEGRDADLSLDLSRKRMSRRRVYWVAFVVINASIVGWILRNLYQPPAAIRISRKTTFVTEPIHSSGYVDLGPEKNRVRREGLPARAKFDPEGLLAEVQSFRSAFVEGRSVEELFSRHRDAIAKAIRENEGVLEIPQLPDGLAFGPTARWADATALARWRRADDLRRSSWPFGEFVSAAAERFHRNAASGDSTAAASDVRFLVDFAAFYSLRDCAQFESRTIGRVSDELITQCAQLINDRSVSTEEALRLMRPIPVLDDVYLRRLIAYERLMAIEGILLSHNSLDFWTRSSRRRAAGSHGKRLDELEARWIWGRIDWNLVLVETNKFFDELEAAMNEPRELRLVRLKKVRDRYESWRQWSTIGVSSGSQSIMTAAAREAVDRAEHLFFEPSWAISSEDLQLFRAALHIRSFESDTGQLPVVVDEVPAASELLQPADFCKPPFRYHRTSAGFEFRIPDREAIVLQADDNGIRPLRALASCQRAEIV